ncbi:MAG: hypothetical protein V2J55_14615 [Candidatus Competibacteraceae bacterium]|jgi:hypothetical protein|nr:hypothetical protein [Candidatus Competibacteraceae bacterium]
MIRTPFIEFDFSGTSIYPTTEGAYLTISESYETIAQIELGLHHLDETDDFPSDVLYSRFRISDNTGTIWESESRFGSTILVEKMNDLSTPSSLIPFSSAEEDIINLFEGKNVLKGVRYSDDDRFYRSVLINEKIVSFKFHYTTITFDLAFHTNSSVGLTQLYVRLRENSLFSGSDDLGALYFTTYPFIGMNTAFYNSEEEWWQDNPIPAPTPFRKTAETHTPNKNVTYG